MAKQFIHTLKEKAGQVNWTLLIFLLLVLNVKLVIKVAAVILICIINRKKTQPGDFFKQRYLFFYFGMIAIGLINLVLQIKQVNTTYLMTVVLGAGFWMMSAVIAYQLYTMVQHETKEKLHNTVTVFFILHIVVVFLDLLQIMIETGSINPYTYMGLNVKYYMSTGDYITGISFDAPVTTAMICAFGLLYFLFRQKFLLSMACMAALIIMASNFTNLLLVGVFIFAFAFYSNKIQKSFIVLYLVMLIVFMVKISAKNYEHIGRLVYQVINKPYDLPPVKVYTIDELTKIPDSSLNADERKRKYARIYIDSMNAIRLGADYKEPVSILEQKIIADTAGKVKDSAFYEFKESPAVEENINRYAHFLKQAYTAGEQDSLAKQYNWNAPGKWIATKQLVHFFRDHKTKMVFGNGIANFSSRLAFKATMLDIGGRYPQKLKYIHSDFFMNHLYAYLYFHSKEQMLHKASNTPDSVYHQVAGEYGIAGLVILLLLYLGFFIRRVRGRSFGLPLLLLLADAFFGEYWFEQFSVVVLFELLFFIDMKERREELKV